MKIELKEIAIKDVANGYVNDAATKTIYLYFILL